MGLFVRLGLRRSTKWDTPTLLDEALEAPLHALAARLYRAVLWLRGTPVRPPKARPAVRVVCLSDTHDGIVASVPDGDLLIHAGDLTSSGRPADIQRQVDWLASLPHRHKVLVSGNHDSWFDINARSDLDALSRKSVSLRSLHHLQRRPLTLSFRRGRKLNLYGAADVPRCGGDDNAFQYERCSPPWAHTVPMDTDILITHAPPKSHLDLQLGCAGLLAEVWRVRPRLHVFGHVHCGRGRQAVFWDACQRSYEAAMARPPRGPVRDLLLPNRGWLLALQVLYHGLASLLWQWRMLGPGMAAAAGGSVMINAAMQRGNTGQLAEGVSTIEI